MIRDVALLLRLSVRLHRSRTDAGLSHLRFDGIEEGLRIHVDTTQAAANPLTVEDLNVEAKHWARMNRVLDFAQQSVP